MSKGMMIVYLERKIKSIGNPHIFWESCIDKGTNNLPKRIKIAWEVKTPYESGWDAQQCKAQIFQWPLWKLQRWRMQRQLGIHPRLGRALASSISPLTTVTSLSAWLWGLEPKWFRSLTVQQFFETWSLIWLSWLCNRNCLPRGPSTGVTCVYY
jgi:hypothetical protein